MTGESPHTPDPNVGRREPAGAPPPGGPAPGGQPAADHHTSSPPAGQSDHDRGPAGGQPTYAPAGSPAGPGNTPAVISLVLGILAVIILLFSVGFLSFISLPLGIAGIVLGVIGRRKVARRETTQFGGLAMGGLITSVVATILSALAIVAFVLFVGALSSATPQNIDEIQQQLEEQQEQETP